jgi:cytochrome c oxidase cbb3-type subunit I/II
MIRTMVPDVLRYGEHSRLGESIYDYPFQWGSKRTGPDLARIGGKYPNIWHFNHMKDPRAVSPGSNMPKYDWLSDLKTDIKALPKKIAVQRTLGVPYPAMTRDEIEQGAIEQGIAIATDLKNAGAFALPDSQMVALIAYLQKVGQSESPEELAPKEPWNQKPFPVVPGLPDRLREDQAPPSDSP